ncbi:Predicted pyrophosphatase or phosphodiesterase, AlkP superfamily [Pseudarcicella hirudinis]|uniref:Predicted pyrophosphatase or phosphodiesterase, AlkP superfamily n=1 Tax=Pseudarcicella hirudinis TaxID=1079859 RepID=A0A1I5XG81_9BACT|nr:ectonucleotide pyrophosphatase/phosphodiesterase [Pseudarcicella hirudinis]SFQ30826.1 Predicted pyrophosphatase or phosphodiesterase, AlkP superfamily [Pseudarcicella hirudinis]
MKLFHKLLFFIIFASFAANAQKSKYVVMISIDGFRPDFYRNDEWPTPNLKEMAAMGASANGVRSVFPSVTYPSHTTIITGVLPVKHGIFHNTPFEPTGQTGRWNWDSKLIKAETIWDAARKKGLKTASVHWPVTLGATSIDYNVPETFRDDKGPDPIIQMRQMTTPKGLFEEIELNATGKLTGKNMNSDFLAMDENISRMAAHIIENYKPNLITVHMFNVDHFEHKEGRSGSGVSKAVANVDNAIGRIVEATERAGIKDSTTFLIVGDHGFVDIHSQLAPNVWLVKAGLMEKRKDRGNWKATFLQQGGMAFLYLKDKNDEQTFKQVQGILQNQPESVKKMFKVIPQKELAAIGADPEAKLAITGVQGFTFTDSFEEPFLKPVKGGTHGFFPDFFEIQTGFIAYGAGIRPKTTIPVMGLEDITPLVLQLLNLQINNLDGSLYPGLLKTSDK